MAKKKSFLEIAGGVFLVGIGAAIVAVYRENFLSLIFGFLFAGIGIALLTKD